jgi:replicative DNA helicase
VAVVDDLGHSGMDVPPPSEDFGRQPPQDAAAEQAVLGGMLLSKDAIADVLERLRPGDFYRPAHQNVYDAILDLYGRGEPADAVTVAAELDRRGLLRRIGGAPYLHTLISTVPTAANAGYYAGIVAEKALLRRLVEAGTRVVQYGYAGAEGADVTEIVDRAQAEIYDVTEGRTSEDFVALEDLLQPTMDEIDAIASQGGLARGVPTGFVELDEVTNGLHPGQMIIIAARPGVGKALALNTPLPTPTGWTTMGDVSIGDRLLGADGEPTRVVAATDILIGRPCYEVEFSDGTVIVADASHQWPTGYGIRTTAELRCGMDTIAAAGSMARYVGRAATTLMAPVLQIDSMRRVRTLPVRCVEVDNSAHLYLAGRGMVPTHNSTLGLDFLRSCSIKHQMASVIFSLEMSKSEIVMRLLSAEAKIKLSDMRSGRMSDDDWTRLARRMSEISEAPLYIDDSPNLTMMEIRAKARRLSQKAGLRLVVVDYLQLMTSGKKFESRQQEVSEFSRSMKLLAKELEVPVVAISQLNRGPEQRTDKKPQLSDLRESGCLTADTRILRADTGAEVTFGELMRTGERPLVWSLDERKRMVARPMTNVFPSGRKEVFKMRLASGREIEATANHPFMTFDGWTPLGELKVGDRLAVPRRVPEPVDTSRMDDSEVILLAHMIGDGSCVKNQPIRYASIDEGNLVAVATVTAVRDEYPAARVTTLRLPAPYHVTHRRRNPIAAWLDKLGLFGRCSHEKFVPQEVFALPNDQVALFLRHLWATDGSVRWNQSIDHAQICYASTSRRLVEGIMQLLLRLGVFSRMARVRKPGYRDCWHLYIDRAANQAKFLRDIGVHGERGKSAQEVLARMQSRVRRPGADTVPKEVWTRVREVLDGKGITDRQFAYAMNTHFRPLEMWSHAPGRSKIHRAATLLEDPEIHTLATSDVFWDRIVEIASIGEQEVYDGIVSETHNFVANLISLHNSLEQDSDVVILLNRPDAFERDDPRGGEADLILAKHRNGPTKTITVAHQLHLSRFANMAKQ